MLEGEVLKRFDFEGFEFINVDDRSRPEERIKGKVLCAKNNITYLQNEGSGVQWATDTLIKFVKKNRPDCKWVICFQHDTYPLSDNFFYRIAVLAKHGLLDDYGALGFNMLDHGEYCLDHYARWQRGEKPLSGLGIFHLSVKDRGKRVILPHRTDLVSARPELYGNPFIAEFPMWTVIGLNVEKWEEHVLATDQYEFHLWAPDVCTQLMLGNVPTLILPNLYFMNNQHVKEKYGISKCSVNGSKSGDEDHFGNYGLHLIHWKQRWRWNYEDISDGFPSIEGRYNGTLISDFYFHNHENGPLRSIDLGDY